ncbi:PucR family transcriptional regulator [Nocardia sp. NPDC127579]|uniref:PucR family transcriptional regulator n=1 Tax=Nocardia sp. NPDC127579 TaxID=3345402 RepID=UPI0036270A7D
MSADYSARPGRGSPPADMSSALQNVRNLARHMADRFGDADLPGNPRRSDIGAITRTCLDLAVAMLDGKDIPAKTNRLHSAAARWAREGIGLDIIHQAVHEGFQAGFELLASSAAHRNPASHTVASNVDELIGAAKLVGDVLNQVTSTVSSAYLAELQTATGDQDAALHGLASALLNGLGTATMARECGVTVADSYHVVALTIATHPVGRRRAAEDPLSVRRRLHRLRTELARRCRGQALSLLAVDSGIILVPTWRNTEGDLAAHLTEAARVVDVPGTAALVSAAAHDIPTAAEQARELLDVVRRLDFEPGLYQLDNLALEYQLTRPGPGREELGALLDPLDDHPELLQTLQIHIGNNLNRQRTARLMHVHANTVDYRLKRIGQLTGFDPALATGLWHLRSAMVARSYRAG